MTRTRRRQLQLPAPLRAVGNALTGMLWVFAIAGTLTAMAIVQPMLLRLAVPGLLVIILVWSVTSSLQSPAQNLACLLGDHRFKEAFGLARRHDLLAALREHLQGPLPLPAPGLRGGLEHTFEELATLHSAVHDAGNVYIVTSLIEEFQTATDQACDAFWDLLRNLAVTGQQQAGFNEDHPKIRRIAKLVEELQFAATEARRKLAELTLGASEPERQQAREALEELRQRGEALRRREPLVH